MFQPDCGLERKLAPPRLWLTGARYGEGRTFMKEQYSLLSHGDGKSQQTGGIVQIMVAMQSRGAVLGARDPDSGEGMTRARES